MAGLIYSKALSEANAPAEQHAGVAIF